MATGTTSEFRARVVALLTGAYSADDRGIPAGHFTECPKDCTLEAVERGTLERRFVLSISSRVPLGPVIQGNALALYRFPFTVSVGYVRTLAGDGPEALGADSGPADDEAIEDRVGIDQHLIESALLYQPSTAGLTPAVIAVRPTSAAPTTRVLGDRAIATFSYEFLARVTLAGTTYAPSL